MNCQKYKNLVRSKHRRQSIREYFSDLVKKEGCLSAVMLDRIHAKCKNYFQFNCKQRVRKFEVIGTSKYKVEILSEYDHEDDEKFIVSPPKTCKDTADLASNLNDYHTQTAIKGTIESKHSKLYQKRIYLILKLHKMKQIHTIK